MSNDIRVTFTGNVCAEPEQRHGKKGGPFTVLRVAVNESWHGDAGWVEGPTSFIRVTAFGALGQNVAASVGKGQPICVHGRLRIDTWTTTNGETRVAPEVRASAIGHDLSKGIAVFTRPMRAPRAQEQTALAGADSPQGIRYDTATGEVLDDPASTGALAADDLESIGEPQDARSEVAEPDPAGVV